MKNSTLTTGPSLRCRLEAAFAQGQLEEAARLTRLVDQIQIRLLQKETITRRQAV